MARRAKVPTGEKLAKKLGIQQSLPGELYGPTGHRRKPHNKPLKRPLLGILGGKNMSQFKF